MKNFIGVNRHHNGTTTLIKDGNVILSIEEERLNRWKYEGTPILGILESKKYIDEINGIGIAGFLPLNVVENNNIGNNYDMYSLLVARTFLIDKDKIFYSFDYSQDHHLTHAAGAFYNSGFDEAVSIVLDGAGSKVGLTKDKEESYTSFLCSYPNDFKVIEKTYYNRVKPHTKENPKSLGRQYAALTSHYGFYGTNDCGKVMGLSSYGKKRLDIDFYDFLSDYDTVNKYHPLYEPTLNMKDFQLAADVAFSLQKFVEEECLKIVLRNIEKTGCKNICVSGGFFMNCVNNYNLIKNLPEGTNLYVEPIAHDGGTALGAAKLAYYQYNEEYKKIPQTTTYYGPIYKKSDIAKRIVNENAKPITYQGVASLLKDNKIVAIYQGRSEQGPRALGNRSILFNPKNKDGKDIVNTVKKREHFRPFAGTILQEYMNEYFDMAGLKESPFMCYAVDVKEEKIKEIPAITHVDNTCRIQTLKKEFNPHFYNLISEFNKLTGTPILMNTSFNLAGEPIVETIDDALKTLHNSDIDYLYLPELNIIIE